MDLSFDELPGNLRCVRLMGRLDAAGADQIDTRFTAVVVSGGHPVIVDLSSVSFVASMGIRLLIASAKGVHLKGAKMALFGATELVRDALDQVALDQIIPVVDTQQQAIEKVSA